MTTRSHQSIFPLTLVRQETWKRIKMVDNIDTVLEKLMRCHQMSSGPGQIKMKYIVLTDANDIYED